MDSEALHVFGHACCESVDRLREENARLVELNRYNVAQAKADIERLTRERDIALVHGPEDMIRALEELTRERDEARAMIADLRTDAGKAAFALANGWPLPEERDAFRAEVARLTAALAGTVAQVEDQRKRAEAAEAKVARCVEARYAILSAYHDGPPEAMSLALQQLTDALAAAKGGK